MKGVIFCLLKKMVVTRIGPEAWDTLVERSTLSVVGGDFEGATTYPDEDMYALVGAASEVTGRPAGELLRAFARFAFPDLAAVDARFVPPGSTARGFLRSIDSVIHTEVRKQQPGAGLPYFGFEDSAADRLVMLYRSPRGLCELVAGFIDGVSDYFGEEITQTQTQCRRDGHADCRFELHFPGKPPASA